MVFQRANRDRWERAHNVLLLVNGGVVATLEAYLDESARQCGVFSIAGYLFEPAAAREYSRRAREAFGRFGGCHMKNLAHKTKAFRDITDEERDALVRTAVELTNHYITAGVVVSCWEQDIKAFAPDFIRGFRHAYSICAHLAAANIGYWLRERWPGGCGGVRYFFEENEHYYPDANVMLSNAKVNAHVRRLYQYREHTSVRKLDAPPLWAADLLAWEWSKYWDETVATSIRPMRRSLEALLRPAWDFAAHRNPKYRLFHLGGERMIRYLTTIRDLGIKQFQEDNDQPPEQASFSDPGRQSD